MSTQTRLADSIRDGARLGAELLQSVADSRAVRGIGSRPLGGCSCNIPPPCWMPKPLGTVKSVVCAGGTAIVRIRVTNCAVDSQDYRVEVAGDAKGAVAVSALTLKLGPMERGVVTLTRPSSAEASKGESELLVWVHGCHDHYARWTVTVGRGSDSCHELDVEDCPDYVHHWYDHFYCLRPCPSHG